MSGRTGRLFARLLVESMLNDKEFMKSLKQSNNTKRN